MVNNRLLHPQEIETFYVIPTIRKYFAEALLKQGLKQKDIAAIFGVTSAAVSQYFSEKRANEFDFSDDVLKEINKIASTVKDQQSYLMQTQRILQFIRQSATICKIHKLFSDVPNNCDPDIIGCRTHARANVKF